MIERNSKLLPIRLTFYYYDFNLGSTFLNTNFKKNVIPAVSNFFSHALQVYQVTGNLTMAGLATCGSEIMVPEVHQINGLANTDVLIYLTTNNSTGQPYIAYSGACAVDSFGLGNVFAGRIVVNVANFIAYSFGVQFSIIAHESTHLLGFSNDLYSY